MILSSFPEVQPCAHSKSYLASLMGMQDYVKEKVFTKQIY